MEIMGREVELGIATEASRGSAETVADKWFRNVTAHIIENADYADDDTSRGVFEDMDGRRVVSKYAEGDLEGILHVDALGYLLANVYGKVATSTVSGSVKDHEFTLKQSPEHISLTVFAKDGGVQQVAIGNCMVNTLELNVAVDDYLRFRANIMGGQASDNSDTVSYDTEYDFISRDVVVKIADSEGGLAGASAIKVKDLSLTWDQGVIRNQVVGSYFPDDHYNSKLGISGSFTLDFTDETYKDLALGDSAKYMQITITGAADIGSGNNPTITILLNKALFENWDRTGGKDELVTQTIEFRAFYNTSDSQQSKVTLRNLTSSYANVPSN